jgi:hypothetical protein
MSYSFSAKGASKAALQAAVAAELAKVVEAQPVHAADRLQAAGAVATFVDLLQNDATRDYAANVSGSVSSTDEGLQHAGISINVSLVSRP